jgi:hypothetical protein
MNNTLPPDVVEKRGKELQEMILSFAGINPVKKENSLGSLTEISNVFGKRCEDIQQLPCDEITREALLANLAMEKARAIRKFQSQ